MSEYRIKLSADDFRQLVAGQAIEVKPLRADDPVIKVILEDMGWPYMLTVIQRAMDDDWIRVRKQAIIAAARAARAAFKADQGYDGQALQVLWQALDDLDGSR